MVLHDEDMLGSVGKHAQYQIHVNDHECVISTVAELQSIRLGYRSYRMLYPSPYNHRLWTQQPVQYLLESLSPVGALLSVGGYSFAAIPVA